MPINPTIRSLVSDGRFSQQDAAVLRQAVQAGQVTPSEAREALERYAEAMEPEAARLLRDTFQAPPQSRLTSLPPDMLDQTLQRGPRSSDTVQLLQRGLMAVGLSSENPAMALRSGADGIFGAETEASVRAFQKAHGLPQTGRADPATLQALQRALTSSPTAPPAPAPPGVTPPPGQPVRPSTGLRRDTAATPTPTPTPATPATPTPAAPATPTPTPSTTTPSTRAAPTVGVTLPAGVRPGTTEATIAAARDLATGARAADYGTVNPWRNIDPNHAVAVDRRIGGLANRWKCNLFGGNALAAAGFEPPYYGNRNRGEYPVAEQWHRWSTPTAEFRARAQQSGEPVVDHARRAGNQSRFDLADEVKPNDIADPAARRARVEALLARVQPGDVVTVDHPGASGSDGGHVRVCVGRDEQGRPLFAQASQMSAEVRAEAIDDADWLTRDAIYILRPNTPRQSGR